MSKHHHLSPSKYNAWAECLCFDSSERSSAEANAGTKIHEELAKALVVSEYEPDESTARWGADVVRELAQGCPIACEVQFTGKGDNLEGIFGTADVVFNTPDGILNIADMKSFSDGTTDYLPQLKGYCALNNVFATVNDKVVLHVLHGGSRTVETVYTTVGKCREDTIELLKRVLQDNNKPCLCKWCKHCKKVGSCMETNNAVQVVSENGLTFSKLSLCQKLVVCEAVERVIKSLKEEAKRIASESDDKAIEMDGIRYELKPWGGKSVVHDICELAGAAASPKVFDRKGNEVEIAGLTGDELLKLCDLPKTRLVDAIKAKNATNSVASKAAIERWCADKYDKTEGEPRFVRTK